MMKKLFYFLLLIISVQSFGQTPTRKTGFTQYFDKMQRTWLWVDSLSNIAYKDTTGAPVGIGETRLRPQDSTVYFCKSLTVYPRWQAIDSGGGLPDFYQRSDSLFLDSLGTEVFVYKGVAQWANILSKPNSGDFIYNQNASAQTANYWIQGNAILNSTGPSNGKFVSQYYIETNTAGRVTLKSSVGGVAGQLTAETYSAGAWTPTGAVLQIGTSGGNVVQVGNKLTVDGSGVKVFYPTGTPATGDIFYVNSSGYIAKLAAGTDGDVLTVASGLPSWAAPTGGGSTPTLPQVFTAGSTFSGNATITMSGNIFAIQNGAGQFNLRLNPSSGIYQLGDISSVISNTNIKVDANTNLTTIAGKAWVTDTLTATTMGTSDSSNRVATTAWVKRNAGGGGGGGVSDHGALTGLTDDDHTIYALLAGRSGGQTLIGGTGTTDDLIFQTTSGAGTTGADFIFKGGNNGGTELVRILNSGLVGFGTASPGSYLAGIYGIAIKDPTGTVGAAIALNGAGSNYNILYSDPSNNLKAFNSTLGATSFSVSPAGNGEFAGTLKVNSISQDDTEGKVVVWNSTAKVFEWRDATTLGGSNFATSNLTFTGNRTHTLGSYFLQLNGSNYINFDQTSGSQSADYDQFPGHILQRARNTSTNEFAAVEISTSANNTVDIEPYEPTVMLRSYKTGSDLQHRLRVTNARIELSAVNDLSASINLVFLLKSLPVYADNTAASSLETGQVYRTSTGQLMVKY